MKKLFLFILTLLCVDGSLAQKKITHPSHIPNGMKLVWSDEFNDHKLDNSKWSTHYYSTFDFAAKTNWADFKSNNLAQPALSFSDSSITLVVTDNLPERTFWPSTGRKISSIQTYDWLSDKNLMGDKFVGGYIEARIKRVADKSAKLVNGAFWMDSPGPDMKYYIESGNNALDVNGIRPRGQVFEVDFCENMNTEIVLHGNVDKNGKFEHNIGHFIIPGEYNDKWITHSMLWTPAGMRFYLDGKEVASSWNQSDIKSPNHYMNFYLGMYANGAASMEVDYFRFYQWDLKAGNELPNGDFEYKGSLMPWQGEAEVTPRAGKSGKFGLVLKPGQSVNQYLYLDHSRSYDLSMFAKGGILDVDVANIELVNGSKGAVVTDKFTLSSKFSKQQLKFTTQPEQLDHKRTVCLTITNSGNNPVVVDDITIKKQ